MIWIVGLSLIRNASQHIRRRPVGQDLGLQRYGFLVSWAGYGSLILDEVIGVTKTYCKLKMHQIILSCMQLAMTFGESVVLICVTSSLVLKVLLIN